MTFSTIDDVIPEPAEMFTVTLQSTSDQVVIGDQSTSDITIPANDDAAGIFSFEVSYGKCGQKTITFPIINL